MIYELTSVKDATKVENNEELAKIAEELGLEVQARRYSKRSVEDCFTRLTADEIAIWMAYCPMAYWLKADSKANKLIQDYAFDTIPGPVLRHWKVIRDDFAFDNFMIRTTERTEHMDPLLMGTHGANVYLLARWGEEAPGLLSYPEVAKKVLDAVIQRHWRRCSWPFQAAECLSDLRWGGQNGISQICERILNIWLTPSMVREIGERTTDK